MKSSFAALVLRYLSGLKYPWVFGLVALFFVVDLLFPDVIPFADEVLLGLLTLLLGAWRKRKDVRNVAVTNVAAEAPALPSNSSDRGVETS